ncbi:hypothetical protein [Sinorhizobium meliloti]|uniref:hypothetical protein n=1 Tax=Rhizobium meliloti TaxID=382 RepID=UPI000A515EF8|nr:hypothetical protein [Sinorhizobium meliloti]
MLVNRRQFCQASVILPFMQTSLAFGDELEDPEEVPFIVGRADFSGAWKRVDAGSVVADFVAPRLDEKHISELTRIQVNGAGHVDDVIQRFSGNGCLTWFKQNIVGKKYWENVSIDDSPASRANFSLFWDKYCERNRTLTLLEFLAYMTVFANEVGGNLTTRSERINSLKHKLRPGITYLYDRFYIQSGSRRFQKMSYNGAHNRTCYQLFHDDRFLEQHKHLPLAEKVARTSDQAWKGDAYPRDRYPVSPESSETGIILECDFFKFRGRGLIQTTWRSNYRHIVQMIKSYQGQSSTIASHRESWRNIPDEDALSSSTNSDWDELFAASDREILTFAVAKHAEVGRYLPLSQEPASVNGTKIGSILRMGVGVGGDKSYGHTLRARMHTLCNSLLG